MKRMAGWVYLAVLLAILMDYTDGRPASELLQPDLIDELTVDEWPVGDENANDNLDPMDIDERIYEMEALMAERQEQTLVDNINVSNGDEMEEEEDDVDQDDYQSDDDEDDDDQQDSEGLGLHQSFDNKINDEASISTMHPILISVAAPKATSKLQQQEERDLEVLDQSIIDTFQAALDTVKQDRPQGFIPLDKIPPATTDVLVETQTSAISISLFLTSGFHVSASWSSYWILGILLSLITLSYRKFREQSIRDYHQLPSYVYKQKSSVD